MTNKEAITELELMRKFNYTLAPQEVFDLAIKALEEETPKGEWKVRPHTDADGDCDGYELYCSECGHVKVILVGRSITLDEATERLKNEHKNFCEECGAKMKGGAENDI